MCVIKLVWRFNYTTNLHKLQYFNIFNIIIWVLKILISSGIKKSPWRGGFMCASRGVILKKGIALCKRFCREAEPLVFEKDFCGGARVGERVVVV